MWCLQGNSKKKRKISGQSINQGTLGGESWKFKGIFLRGYVYMKHMFCICLSI